jgi:hypothetical protein
MFRSRQRPSAVWCLPLLAGVVACSHAQVRVDYVVAGRVVDSQTAVPLEGVRVNVHWPKAMQADPKAPPSRETITDMYGRYLVFHPTQRDAKMAVGFIPTSVDEGNAIGTALTMSCPNCRTVSVGIGKDTMDFLTRDEAGKVVVGGSTSRSQATIEARPDETTVVQYDLPDIPVELQEPQGPPPIPPETAPTPPKPSAPKAPSPDA